MTDDNHNTLDDLVRVARSRLRRCDIDGCDAVATSVSTIVNRHLCDDHAADRNARYESVVYVDASEAPAIRRLVAAGILTALALVGCEQPPAPEPLEIRADEVAAWDELHAACVAAKLYAVPCADDGILRRRARMAKVKP